MVDVHGYVYYLKHGLCLYGVTCLLLYISAWASALLVQQRWAMRRPRVVGRVTVQTLTLFVFINADVVSPSVLFYIYMNVQQYSFQELMNLENDVIHSFIGKPVEISKVDGTKIIGIIKLILMAANEPYNLPCGFVLDSKEKVNFQYIKLIAIKL
jgi:hypothetical protein